MTYASLMVHLDLGTSNTGLLEIAADLAERFHAGIVGIAARQPMQIVYGDGCYTDVDLIERDRIETERQIGQAEAEFHAALRPRVADIEWRSSITVSMLPDYIAKEARSADLVLIGTAAENSLNSARRVQAGSLVMQLGRPLLVVPAGLKRLEPKSVVIGWNDTREARRAALDAMPLLRMAGRVTVVEIAAEERFPAARTHLDDVVAWLKRHGVVADRLVCASTGDDETRLNRIAWEHEADLIVAGAYGHGRLREWAFGGVTRDLLQRAKTCLLMSH